MEISSIMNIHELALNRTVKQKAGTQPKKEKEIVQNNTFQPEQVDFKEKGLIGALADKVHQQADMKEEAPAEATVTGNIVNVHT